MSGPTLENFAKPPGFVTGGCLCGSIRYRIDFPKDHDFLKSSGSCQCTQCRRSTGSLFFASHTIPVKSLTYTTPSETLKNFVATPGYQRGICTNCGSFLYWRDESCEQYELAVGCIDPEWLVGKEGFGFALANMSGPNVWCQNEIPGVTDTMIGKDHGCKFATSGSDAQQWSPLY
ncbi:glutathione-dependent formaldehyde-activating enzyme [Xylariaceae sp. FL1651]|nr:glutathione-dependent formaldehyde-activating enzyme [Xylariaceae sp. FL1651]